MAHLIETMMYAGETPWHGLGTRVPSNLPWDEAIVAAGLSWTVRLAPVYTLIDGAQAACPGSSAVIRHEDSQVLSVVSEGYQPVQNGQAFGLFQRLFGQAAVLHTAGSLKGGRVVWGLAELPGEYKPAGEQHRRFILVSTSHDGTRSLRAACTAVRVVCNNTLTMALSGDLAGAETVSHRGDVEAKLDRAGDHLAAALGIFERYESQASKLASKRLSQDEREGIIRSLVGTGKRAEAAATDILQRASFGPGNGGIRGSAWALLQGVTEHVDHERLGKADIDRRFAYQTTGAGAGMKSKAFDLLLAA